ncbi:MAG: hypothetical protein LBD64_06855 [Odoribacteraceae bacterium]|jgi:hypothetical protein|nr:hypothetical protein [Odoribacteraceae bacterium]
MKQTFISLLFLLPSLLPCTAQVVARQERAPSRLVLGGYGEVLMQRAFYSDNAARYTNPSVYKDKVHGRFDIPRVVIYASQEFGRGWKMSTEIEIEHGGAGTTYEIENEETGEYETEIEKGGEVAIEQFWIEKSWSPVFNLRVGHLVVPVGLTNSYHLPTEYLTVSRPEEESAILPCTWHETGVGIRGQAGKWSYEALFIAGLDAERFNNANWIKGGSTSPYEFSIATSYAGAFRVEARPAPGLRLGLSAYRGNSARNSLKPERYEQHDIRGAVTIGAFDAVYRDSRFLARSCVVYGHLGDSRVISTVNKRLPSASPSPRTDVASDAIGAYVEVAYDALSCFRREDAGDKLYVYARHGFHDSMFKVATGVTAKPWSRKRVTGIGASYLPIEGIVVKAEYSARRLVAPYNNEPAFSLGIAYSRLFTL